MKIETSGFDDFLEWAEGFQDRNSKVLSAIETYGMEENAAELIAKELGMKNVPRQMPLMTREDAQSVADGEIPPHIVLWMEDLGDYLYGE